MSAMTSCSGGCKREWPSDEMDKSGWDLLAITGRYRCFACTKLLAEMSKVEGTPSAFTPDPLPADSIGALKKLPVPPALVEGVKP